MNQTILKLLWGSVCAGEEPSDADNDIVALRARRRLEPLGLDGADQPRVREGHVEREYGRRGVHPVPRALVRLELDRKRSIRFLIGVKVERQEQLALKFCTVFAAARVVELRENASRIELRVSLRTRERVSELGPDDQDVIVGRRPLAEDGLAAHSAKILPAALDLHLFRYLIRRKLRVGQARTTNKLRGTRASKAFRLTVWSKRSSC